MKTLKELLGDAANQGRTDKTHEDAQRAEKTAGAAQAKAAEAEKLTTAAQAAIANLPKHIQLAAKRSEPTCTAHFIPSSDIDFPREYYDGEPLPVTCVKGVSRRVFELLQEAGVDPTIEVKGRTISIAVKVPTGA